MAVVMVGSEALQTLDALFPGIAVVAATVVSSTEPGFSGVSAKALIVTTVPTGVPPKMKSMHVTLHTLGAFEPPAVQALVIETNDAGRTPRAPVLLRRVRAASIDGNKPQRFFPACWSIPAFHRLGARSA